MEYLYLLIIRPIVFLIELIFVLLHRFLGNPGAALIGVSIAVSFFVLPIYIKADKVQEESIAKQKSMEPWIKHIRRFFKGDERYMMLSAYYRCSNYHPLHILRGTLSILLQIPFFLAAYQYLSSLETLQGVSFGPISDLGAADGLVAVCGISINVLPILMTLINLVSGTIYTRGFPVSQKLQVYLPALVFLVLLYNSPSGLVIYWTMNNLFSLCKNVVLKYVKDRKRFLAVLFALMGAVYVVLLASGRWQTEWLEHDYELLAIYGFLALAFFFPLLWYIAGKLIPSRILDRGKKFADGKTVKKGEYILLALVISVFMGAVIPLSVISSSPLDFVDLFAYRNPLQYVLSTFLLMTGCFCVWGGLLFFMLDKKGQCLFAASLFGFSVFAVMDFYIAVADMGICEMELYFEKEPHFGQAVRYGNALLVAVIFTGAFLLSVYASGIRKYLTIVLMAVFLVISVYRIVLTEKEVERLDRSVDLSAEQADFTLSRDGKNVVVIMLDRAIGGYIPFIMEERPDLLAKMDGFVFYPNTVSTGTFTKYGAPAIFGGYEYTTYAIDSRPDETLIDKHDEALHVLPALFSEHGYKVSAADLPYAGYTDPPNMTIFNDLPEVDAFNLSAHYGGGEDSEASRKTIERNFFIYSFFRTAPAMLQDNIYDHANYLTDRGNRTWFTEDFRREYKALVSLSEHTRIVDNTEGCLMLYSNCVSHEPFTFPQLPDYTLEDHVDNSGFDFEKSREINGVKLDLDDANSPVEGEWPLYSAQYAVTASALLRLADWLDYLKAEGVYDNTRIILVADHGRSLGQFSTMNLENGIDVEAYNALLMEKDFGNSGGLAVDDSFMTNADVPSMAMEGIIESPINPYTGNLIDMSEKEDGVYLYSGTVFDIPPDKHILATGGFEWLYVHDNIFDADNWTITPE